MSSMRDFRPRTEKKSEMSSEGFVAWLSLIAMGMALGFLFGYGLLYT
jgi:hypothetical protein